MTPHFTFDVAVWTSLNKEVVHRSITSITFLIWKVLYFDKILVNHNERFTTKTKTLNIDNDHSQSSNK